MSERHANNRGWRASALSTALRVAGGRGRSSASTTVPQQTQLASASRRKQAVGAEGRSRLRPAGGAEVEQVQAGHGRSECNHLDRSSENGKGQKERMVSCVVPAHGSSQ